jgi:phage gp36-like protein
MMAYCSQDDVELRVSGEELLALADRDGDGAVDAEVVERAVADAAAVVDSYLRVRFAVPVAPVPEVLRTVTVNLAVYYLQLGCDSVTDDARAQHEEDLNWLRDVAAGRASLGLMSPDATALRHESEPRIFGRDEPL